MKDREAKVPWLNRNILGFSLGSFLGDVSVEMTTLILPIFVAGLVSPAIAPWYVGLITGVADAGASFTRIIFGYWSDMVERRKPFIVIGYILSCIFMSLIGFAQHVLFIVVSRLIAWVGKGVREPARDALIAESVRPAYYGRAFGFHRAMDTLGAIVGPLLAFVLLHGVQPRALFFISFIPSFLAVIAIVILTRDVPDRKRYTSANIRTHLARIPRTFWLFAFIVFIFSCANYHLTLIVLRAQDLIGVNGVDDSLIRSETVVLLYALLNTARAFGEYSIGWMSDFYSRKRLLVLVGYGLFGVASLLLALPQARALLSIIFVLGGLSTGSFSALEKAYTADMLSKEVRGTGYGVLHAVRGIGALVSNLAVGFLWSTFTPAIGFLYAALLSFCAALMLLLL